MKNYLKKCLAVFMAIVTVFSLSTVSFANVAAEPETELEVNNEEVNNENEIVATMYLCSCVYVFPVSGHTWIYVENNTDRTLKVGLYDLPPGQGVSIGSFSFSVADGWGLYYNVEAFRENNKNREDITWSIPEELTASELQTLTDKLVGYYNSWGFVRNCSFFAFNMWNSVTHDGYFSLLIPAISLLMLMIGGADRGTLDMYFPDPSQVYRQSGSGASATLVPLKRTDIY